MKVLKRLLKLVLGISLIAGVGGTTIASKAFAEEVGKKENTSEVFADVKYKTKYVGADGGTFIDNPVVQTVVGVNKGKFSVDIWTNYDTKTGKVTEIDPELNVPFETGNLDGNIYVGYFTFPNSDAPNLSEIGVTLVPKDMPLDISLYAGQIFGEDSGHGQIFKGSVGKTFRLGKNTNASLEGNLTYNNRYFSEKRGFSHVTGTASINYDLADNLSVSSSVSYQEPIGDFKDSLENEIYGSVGINTKF